MVAPGILRSDIVILYFKYLALIEVCTHSGTSKASPYPLTDHILILSPRLKILIGSTALSMLQTTMMSASSPGLGTLCIFPREIRDEIYRNLVKDYYCFYYPATGPCRWTLRMVLRSGTKKPDLALLLVSKTTYDELSSMFYSESVFQFGFERPYNPTYLPEPILRRMMKIELVFDCSYLHDYHVRAVKMFNNEGTLRDNLTITFYLGPLEYCERLTGRLSEELEMFKSFRTVTLKVNQGKYLSTGSNGEAERKYITRDIK